VVVYCKEFGRDGVSTGNVEVSFERQNHLFLLTVKSPLKRIISAPAEQGGDAV
jgi:hypothetical protein